MALASRPLRQSGRRWLLVGVLATVVVLAVNAAISARSPAPARQLAEQSYMDQVLPAIQGSTQQGQDIDSVRAQALTLSATVITTRLSQVVGDAQATLNTVEHLTAPKDMQTAHDLLVATLAIRVHAAQALSQAMTVTLSGDPIQTAVNAFTTAAADFTAGDLTYQLFLKTPAPSGSTLPPSVWLTDSSVYTPVNLTVFVSSLKSATTLAPVHDTSVVVVTTDPAAESMNGPTEVLPTTKSMNLQIVVANIGNQPEKNLTVSATIAPSFYGPTQMVRDFVNLAPGQRQTVDLGGLRAEPGVPTVLTVKIDTVPAEVNINDNTMTIPFVMH